ncbi:Polyadenylate-binding protein-interacting protein 9 [Diplonema papillatum]|nr:Polyadenylate-binding protein-interacting protein 9 [Diplonema papillatum]
MGKVTNFRLCGDNTHTTRYCFVEYETEQQAEACRAMDGQTFEGHAIHVTPSRTAIETPGTGFAATGTPGPPGVPTTSIMIGGIPETAQALDIEILLGSCGSVKKVDFCPDSTGRKAAVVEMGDSEAVNKALLLNETMSPDGSYKITVVRNRNPIVQAAAAGGLPNNMAYAEALRQQQENYLTARASGFKSRRRRRRSSSSDSSDKKKRRKEKKERKDRDETDKDRDRDRSDRDRRRRRDE